MIIQLRKISSIHNSLGPDDIVMQYSSTSWVVFYVMCGHFSAGAALVVYNGSPLFPDAKQLLRICDRFKVTFLGASPRLLLEIEMSKNNTEGGVRSLSAEDRVHYWSDTESWSNTDGSTAVSEGGAHLQYRWRD